KLDMQDVSVTSGVSRGTLYRYFPTRESLLREVAKREGLRFKEQMLAAIAAAPPGAGRVVGALDYATRHLQEHRALQRLLDTDPALVLRQLRRQFTQIATEFHPVLVPLLGELGLVRRGVVSAQLLADWMLRILISIYLLPPEDAEATSRGMAAVYERLSREGRRAATTDRRHARNGRNGGKGVTH